MGPFKSSMRPLSNPSTRSNRVLHWFELPSWRAVLRQSSSPGRPCGRQFRGTSAPFLFTLNPWGVLCPLSRPKEFLCGYTVDLHGLTKSTGGGQCCSLHRQ